MLCGSGPRGIFCGGVGAVLHVRTLCFVIFSSNVIRPIRLNFENGRAQLYIYSCVHPGSTQAAKLFRSGSSASFLDLGFCGPAPRPYHAIDLLHDTCAGLQSWHGSLCIPTRSNSIELDRTQLFITLLWLMKRAAAAPEHDRKKKKDIKGFFCHAQSSIHSMHSQTRGKKGRRFTTVCRWPRPASRG